MKIATSIFGLFCLLYICMASCKSDADGRKLLNSIIHFNKGKLKEQGFELYMHSSCTGPFITYIDQ